MADAAIFDLTAETALTAAHEFVTQDTSAATRAQAATFALMGGLEYTAASVTTANVTGVVGTLHALDVSGMTADRNFVLPDTARVGERVGVFLTVGDASFELDIVTAATGSLINGANAGGGTSWSRVFITSEVVILRCVKAGGAGDTDWIVEVDGRTQQRGVITKAADQAVANTGDLLVTLDTSVTDIGGVVDTGNNRITVRRAGNYSVHVVASCQDADATVNNRFIVNLLKNGSLLRRGGRFLAAGSDVYATVEAVFHPTLAAADYMQLGVNQNFSASAVIDVDADSAPTLTVIEELSR